MGLSVHRNIAHTTKRRANLETERVECMWTELKLGTSSTILVGYVYRNPGVTYALYDDFVEIMDKVNERNSNIVLLEFNIDLLKLQPAWKSTSSLFGLHQAHTLCNKNNANKRYPFISYLHTQLTDGFKGPCLYYLYT